MVAAKKREPAGDREEKPAKKPKPKPAKPIAESPGASLALVHRARKARR